MKKERSSGIGPIGNRASVQIGRTMKDILLSRWILVSFPVILVPFFIALYTVFDPPSEIGNWPEAFVIIGILLFQQILVLMFTLIYGTSMMNEEIESKTITYLFTRGSKRFEVLYYKFIGVFITLSLLFTISALLAYLTLASHTSGEDMVDRFDMSVWLIVSLIMGCYAYLGIFSFIGIVFKRPLVIGLIFSFFWEVFMVNLPLNVQQVTVMYYIRSIFLGSSTVGRYSDIMEKASIPGSLMALSLTGTVFLLLAFYAISRKDIK